jgi:tetratricopeptide (TPR) repeat protein
LQGCLARREEQAPGKARAGRDTFKKVSSDGMPAVLLPALLLALPPLPLEALPAALRDRVAAAYRKAEADPASADASGSVAMLLHAHDQLDVAEPWYRHAAQLDPTVLDWPYLQGVVQAERGRYEEAARSLRDAVTKRPRDRPARLKLAEVLLARGDRDASAALYDEILKAHPDTPQAHHGAGRVEAARSRPAAAAQRFRRATELFPGYGAAYYALGLAYRDLGRADEARSALQAYEAHRLEAPPLDDPVLARVRQLKTGALAHLAEGVRLGKAGDLEGSIREHEAALEADAGLAQAHANLISLHGRLGRWDKAERHYRAAIALGPGLAEAHYDYGVVLVQQHRPREAAEAFQRALAVNPNYAAAHNNLGNMLEAEGRTVEAEGHYRAAIANDPTYRLARFNLGRVLVAQQKHAEAIAEMEKTLLPEDAETPRYLYALAAAWVRAGDREKGLRYGREAQRKAEARGQAELAATIARDLRNLEGNPP